MTDKLGRLFQPSSIAVIGGGAWCEQVIGQAKKMRFAGEVWPVHSKADAVAELRAFRSVSELPAAPDATFIGVNRQATIALVEELSAMDAGGAVCFASGFSEAKAEDGGAEDLQRALIAAAGTMPILGPNCYGFINALDGALLWPDQHGCKRVESGVAILTQSSNIAINLTMQKRGLPIAYTITCGNMAQTTQAEIALALLDDPRVTAIGLHIEGFRDLRDWERLASKAYDQRVPLVALKVGRSEQAQIATVSHTASLAGSDAGADAFLRRLGIARVKTLPDMLETLKLLHCYGPLPNGNIASISCSGGEACLIADMALGTGLSFPALSGAQNARLSAALGPMVALSNPLDYHTYIWRDRDAMVEAWSSMTGDDISMTFSVVDYPTTDASDWECATYAALATRAQTGARFGVVSSLPELMPEGVANDLLAEGVVPFCGLSEALAAVVAASECRSPNAVPVFVPEGTPVAKTLTEADSKAQISEYGVPVPRNRIASRDANFIKAVRGLSGPFAIKGVGLAHKSEHAAVRLGVGLENLAREAQSIDTEEILIEEMVSGHVAELLVGVVRDPAHGFVLTLGAGGVFSELLRDTVSMLLPVDAGDVVTALDKLAVGALLRGYRGKPAADIAAIIDAVLAVQSYVLDEARTVTEVEINPLLCAPDRAVAVDALIRKA